MAVADNVQNLTDAASPAGAGDQRWTTALAGEADRAEIRELFASVFGHAMPDAFWQWKYGDDRGHAVVARDAQGHMVAHYGGISRPIRYLGRDELAVQICDVMVEQRERGVLTRKGPFYLVTAEFLDRYIGFGRKHLVGFGFPSLRHLRLAEKQGLYTKVDIIHELRWPAAGRLPLRMAAQPMDWTDPTLPGALDMLWEEMQASLADRIVPVRDAAWWRFRYQQHPQFSYRAYVLKNRLTRRPVGCIAVKIGAGEHWELMDWIAPVEQAPLMVDAARALAAKAGAGMVTGWFSSGVLQAVQSTDPDIVDIGVGVPTNILTPGPAAEELSGRWWLSGGDTDFR